MITKRTFKISLTGFLFLFIITSFFIRKNYEDLIKTIDHYFNISAEFKQSVIQKVAIYEDYVEADTEKELRTFLLNDHLKIAYKGKYEQVKDDKDLNLLIKDKKLKAVPNGIDELIYFYNVPPEYRYLRDFTIDGLNLLAKEFQKNLPEQVPGVKVKLAISSATRPVSYQKNLREKNENASLESTHSFGISFDIFYDDYYVGIIPLADKSIINKKIFEKIRRQHGFALGSALRRQFQTVLSKTLLSLQREHKLYAILEKNQRCYHVTILPP